MEEQSFQRGGDMKRRENQISRRIVCVCVCVCVCLGSGGGGGGRGYFNTFKLFFKQ